MPASLVNLLFVTAEIQQFIDIQPHIRELQKKAG
jgi:hypothetical protein